jgi:hypothetical protein
MTRQVIDHRDGTENGVAIPPASKQLVGSQLVPYIYEDFTNHQQVVDAFMKIYEMTPEQKDAMKKKVLEYVDYEFNYKNVISKWDETLEKCIKDFKIKRPKSWSIQEIKNPNPQPTTTTEQTEKILEQNKIVLEPEVKKLPIDITAFLMKNINITRFIGVTK